MVVVWWFGARQLSGVRTWSERQLAAVMLWSCKESTASITVGMARGGSKPQPKKNNKSFIVCPPPLTTELRADNHNHNLHFQSSACHLMITTVPASFEPSTIRIYVDQQTNWPSFRGLVCPDYTPPPQPQPQPHTNLPNL